MVNCVAVLLRWIAWQEICVAVDCVAVDYVAMDCVVVNFKYNRLCGYGAAVNCVTVDRIVVALRWVKSD